MSQSPSGIIPVKHDLRQIAGTSQSAANVIDPANNAVRVNLVAGAGGGGGPATIADGADVNSGTTTDAAIATDTTGTLSGKLRGLVKLLASVISSNRVVVDPSGVTSPVSGPLTDAQLRAAAVPVSGTFFQGTQPVSVATTLQVDVTDEPARDLGKVDVASLDQYTPLGGRLPVDGSGVTQPVSTKTDLAPSSPAAASVGVASAQAVAANASRKGLLLVNTSNNTISLGLGAPAVLNSGITLTPGGSFWMDEYSFDTGAVNAIASAASSNLAIQEFV